MSDFSFGPPERVAHVLALIETFLDGVEHRAPTYARHPEALEAQVFQMVRVRQVLFGYPEFDAGEALSTFSRSVNGQPDCGALFCILRDEGKLSELPRLLADFARWVAREWPPR